MNYTSIISLVLLLMFSTCYLGKLLLLARNNRIKANVLGKSNKAKSIRFVELFVRFTSTLWLLVWFFEILASDNITAGIGSIVSGSMLSHLGLAVTFFGVLIFTMAVYFMKTSWRVGIDKETTSSLVTIGIYKYSRNPAFVGFDLMFFGLFLTYSNYLTLLVMLLNMLGLHLLILQEEKHLTATFGSTYLDYKRNTARYIRL